MAEKKTSVADTSIYPRDSIFFWGRRDAGV